MRPTKRNSREVLPPARRTVDGALHVLREAHRGPERGRAPVAGAAHDLARAAGGLGGTV